MELVFLIAPQYNVPPMLVAAIIIKESQGNVYAERHNTNGTVDRGLMQLNSSWFQGEWQCAETNIKNGTSYLAWLYIQTKHTSPYWWSAVVSYNCGLTRFKSERGPPKISLDYADAVFMIWESLDNEGLGIFLRD
jgi:soluble lytic murein transglycosylase-like protein